MGKEVGFDADEAAQLDRSAVGHGKLVDDRQADGVTERAVASGSKSEEIRIHVGNCSYSWIVGSMIDERRLT